MTTRLVDSDWSREIVEALRADAGEMRIVSPFIKNGALNRLLAAKPKTLQAITRFNLADFAEGVSDISALRQVLEFGGSVRGIKNLHAKMYLFGASRAIITSANLTEAALSRNHEFGLVSEDREVISACRRYFDRLWNRGDADLVAAQLDEWNATVTRHRAEGGRPIRPIGLGDFGADADMMSPPLTVLPIVVTDAQQSFVKFLGRGSDRAVLSFPIIDQIDHSGCHWALTYPANKRPWAVRDGALMFISRLTTDPNDIRIFGRAIGLAHSLSRDNASADELARRPWKESWPRYIRVSGAEFVAGTMANGVSLNELMNALGAESFVPTQRNAKRGEGNIDPRRAYRQQPAVELSSAGREWLGERLESAFERHGKLPQDDLDQLDWPGVP